MGVAEPRPSPETNADQRRYRLLLVNGLPVQTQPSLSRRPFFDESRERKCTGVGHQLRYLIAIEQITAKMIGGSGWIFSLFWVKTVQCHSQEGDPMRYCERCPADFSVSHSRTLRSSNSTGLASKISLYSRKLLRTRIPSR